MTSGTSSPRPRLVRVDETSRGDHYFLSAEDECYFVYEYTPRAGYTHSAANQLIANLKKSPLRRHREEYRYKGIAIRQCVTELADALNHAWLDGAVLVPIPPSKAEDHPEYDDRMLRVCKGISEITPAEIRPILYQDQSMQAAHEAADGARPSVEDLVAAYRVREDLLQPPPVKICIVDDMLTAGAHYRAAHQILSGLFPQAQIIGVFVARRQIIHDFDIDIDL